jgi:hypothetical protein
LTGEVRVHPVKTEDDQALLYRRRLSAAGNQQRGEDEAE